MADRSNFGSTADIISQITDAGQLQAMLKNPQYAGFTAVIIARLTEINRMRQGAQGGQPPQPSVAQQAMTGQAPPQQAMARGGIVAFKAGGAVKKMDEFKQEEYSPTRGFANGGDVSSAVRAMQRYAPDEGLDEEGFATPPAAPLGMEHRAFQPAFSLPSYRDPYQVRLERAVAASRAAAGAPRATPPTSMEAPAAAALPAAPTRQYSERDIERALPAMVGGERYSTRIGGTGDRAAGIKQYLQEAREAYGANPEYEDARKDIAADRKNALNMAMIQAGLGMAQGASERPGQGILGNIAEGARAGLGTYAAQQKEAGAAQRELMRSKRAEDWNIAQTALGARRGDIQEARQDARMAASLSAGFKPAQIQEMNITRLARALMKKDIADKQPLQDPEMYRLMATQQYAGVTPAMQAAQLRSEAARATAQMNAAAKQLAVETDPVRRAILQQVVDSGGTFDPNTTSGTIRPR